MRDDYSVNIIKRDLLKVTQLKMRADYNVNIMERHWSKV